MRGTTLVHELLHALIPITPDTSAATVIHCHFLQVSVPSVPPEVFSLDFLLCQMVHSVSS